MAKAPEPLEFVERVARRIADARRAAGLTQQQLADRLRVTPRYLQRVEAGQNVTVYWLARIAGALGLDGSELTRPFAEAEAGAAEPARRKGRPARAVTSSPSKASTPRSASKRR